MKQLLSKFEQLLIEKDIPVLNKLDKGIKASEIDSIITMLPKDVKHLYNWRNGLKNEFKELPLGQLWFFNYGLFPSLEASVTLFNKSREFETEWRESLFPVFIGGGGEHYLVECDKSSEQFGKIFFHCISNYEMGVLVSKYDSISHFFTTVFECYLKDVYWYNSQGYFECDFQAEIEIASKINEHSQYWKFLKE